MELILVARNLERVADLATNVAEEWCSSPRHASSSTIGRRMRAGAEGDDFAAL
jgi:phosphate uptake regulator